MEEYRKICDFSDGSFLAYTTGNFDNYRVTFFSADGTYVFSPRDTYFFDELLGFGANQSVWNSIVKVAEQINRSTNFEDVDFPVEIESLQAKKVISAIVAAMIAEERKANTKLGKRIKLLGIHQILIQGIEPKIAASWSRDKKWRIIDAECRKFNI